MDYRTCSLDITVILEEPIMEGDRVFEAVGDRIRKCEYGLYRREAGTARGEQ